MSSFSVRCKISLFCCNFEPLSFVSVKINACLAVVENDALRPVEIIDLYMLYSYRYSSFNLV